MQSDDISRAVAALRDELRADVEASEPEGEPCNQCDGLLQISNAVRMIAVEPNAIPPEHVAAEADVACATPVPHCVMRCDTCGNERCVEVYAEARELARAVARFKLERVIERLDLILSDD